MSRGVITIDWMVMAVAVIALLFLIGTMIRTSVEVDPSTASGGMLAMSHDDTLLAFQDFSFGAEAWAPSVISDDLPGLGPVLGPFGAEVVERSFTMPSTARAASIQFDLHLHGDWSEGDLAHIALGETEVIEVAMAANGPTVALQNESDRLAIQVARGMITPRPAETALGSTAEGFAVVQIRMILNSPPETIALRLQADASDGAQWTLDNLTVVAIAGDRGR